MTAQKGQCLCGALKFSAQPEDGRLEMACCHCSMCRRWHGGAAMAVSVTGLVFEDDAELGVYESSDYGERCFCKKCGTSLMWRMKDGSHYSMSAHAFYDPSIFKFTKEIFVDDQPTNYAFANATKRLTGAQVIAMFEGQAEGQANG